MGAYHHGDLRAALLQASIEIFENDGIAALSLRAAVRDSSRAAAIAAWAYVHGLATLIGDRQIVPGKNGAPELEDLMRGAGSTFLKGFIGHAAGIADHAPEGETRSEQRPEKG